MTTLTPRDPEWREKFAPYLGGQSAKRYLSRGPSITPNAILPRSMANRDGFLSDCHFALDEDVLRMTEEMVSEYARLFPATVGASGLAGANGVPGPLTQLLSVSGIGADPKPIPLSSNDRFVEANGRATAIQERHRPIFKEVMRLMFGHAIETDAHYARDATTAAPYYDNTPQYKLQVAAEALTHPDEFLDLGVGGPPTALDWLHRYHACHIASMYQRMQADKAELVNGHLTPKPRTAPTEIEARSGIFEGRTFADKTIHDPVSGLLIPNHFAMRVRDVFALNGPVNYFLTAIYSCFRAVYLERFASVFKCRGDADKQAFLDKYKYVVGSDVKTMDKLVPRWFLDDWCEEQTYYVDERVALLVRRGLAATYVAPNPYRDTPADYNPIYGPAPHEAIATNCPGLTSGIAVNPDIGKSWMVFVYLAAAFDLGIFKSPKDIAAIMTGTYPDFGLQDSSDDATFGTNREDWSNKLRVLKSPYAVLEPETPCVYLGSVYSEGPFGAVSAPNPNTYLSGYIAREMSIDKKPMHIYGGGVVAREMIYSQTPVWAELSQFRREMFLKHLGHDPIALAKRMATYVPSNLIDALVQDNPQAIHYKVLPKEVDPVLLKELVATLPSELYFGKIRHLFKVSVAKKPSHMELYNGKQQ